LENNNNAVVRKKSSQQMAIERKNKADAMRWIQLWGVVDS
jgi:hypothetical protein